MVKTYEVKIYIAGNYDAVVNACSFYCLSGFCVSITKTLFVFTGGMESGVCVGLINYPRFPSETDTIDAKAKELAKHLIKQCAQRSCTVVTPTETIYYSNEAITSTR